MDWELTFELKRIGLDGEETVEYFREIGYDSKERWLCPKCQRLNFIAEDTDDPEFNPHICEGCAYFEEDLPVDIEDDAWWVICSHCDKPIIAAAFGEHLMLAHIKLPQASDTVGSKYV